MKPLKYIIKCLSCGKLYDNIEWCCPHCGSLL
jgi:rRNA maturation endonuclease Nob1